MITSQEEFEKELKNKNISEPIWIVENILDRISDHFAYQIYNKDWSANHIFYFSNLESLKSGQPSFTTMANYVNKFYPNLSVEKVNEIRKSITKFYLEKFGTIIDHCDWIFPYYNKTESENKSDQSLVKIEKIIFQKPEIKKIT